MNNLTKSQTIEEALMKLMEFKPLSVCSYASYRQTIEQNAEFVNCKSYPDMVANAKQLLPGKAVITGNAVEEGHMIAVRHSSKGIAVIVTAEPVPKVFLTKGNYTFLMFVEKHHTGKVAHPIAGTKEIQLEAVA